MEEKFIIKGFAALKEKDDLKEFSYEARPMCEKDVDIKITHCGICHSDIHYINNDWKIRFYNFYNFFFLII